MKKEIKKKIIEILEKKSVSKLWRGDLKEQEDVADQILELFEEEKPAECLDDMARAIGQKVKNGK